jgi:hypothetical protein
MRLLWHACLLLVAPHADALLLKQLFRPSTSGRHPSLLLLLPDVCTAAALWVARQLPTQLDATVVEVQRRSVIL